MKTLIAEDDFGSRMMLQEVFKEYGDVHVATNGKEAIDAARAAIEAHEPYDLICLDIIMPEVDGQEALKQIRDLERTRGLPFSQCSKVFMTSGVNTSRNILRAFNSSCDAYLVKPLDIRKLKSQLLKSGLA